MLDHHNGHSSEKKLCSVKLLLRRGFATDATLFKPDATWLEIPLRTLGFPPEPHLDTAASGSVLSVHRPHTKLWGQLFKDARRQPWSRGVINMIVEVDHLVNRALCD